MPSASQTIFKASDVVVFTPIPDDKWTQLLKVKTLQNVYCNSSIANNLKILPVFWRKCENYS